MEPTGDYSDINGTDETLNYTIFGTDETLNYAIPSTDETLKYAIPSTDETLKYAIPSSDETLKYAIPSTDESLNYSIHFALQISNITNSSDIVIADHNALLVGYILYIVYLIIGSLGILGNLFVILVVSTSKSMMKKMVNWYIINQSAIDLMASTSLILVTIFQEPNRPLGGFADEILCRLWLNRLPLWGFLVSSTYNLVVITAERFIAIRFVAWHKSHFTKRKAVLSMITVWLIGLCYNMSFMIPTSVIRNGVCDIWSEWPSLNVQRFVGFFTLIIQYLIPLGIVMFCYIKMYFIIKPRAKKDSYSPSHRSYSRAMQNIIKALFIVSACFIGCWTCNQVYFLLFNLGVGVDFTSDFYNFTVIAVYTNCCINPVVYMCKYEHFQARVRKICCYRGGSRSTDQHTWSGDNSVTNSKNSTFLTRLAVVRNASMPKLRNTSLGHMRDNSSVENSSRPNSKIEE